MFTRHLNEKGKEQRLKCANSLLKIQFGGGLEIRPTWLYKFFDEIEHKIYDSRWKKTQIDKMNSVEEFNCILKHSYRF